MDAPRQICEKLRRALADRADVHLALLFGSLARGAAGPDSDVDLAVAAPGVDLLQLRATLCIAVGREVDLLDLNDATIPMAEQLLRDGIAVHEGIRGAGARWRSHTLTSMETDRPWYARMREAWLRRVKEEGFKHG